MASVGTLPPSSLSRPTGLYWPCPGARALLNDLVLAKITKLLPPKDLLHLRLTATSWNRAFVPQLRKTHYPRSLDNERLVDEYGIMSSYPHLMDEYTEVMRTRTSQDIPYTRYQFCDLTADVHRLVFEDFFSVCGPSISKIKFSCSDRTLIMSNMKRIKRMIFDLTPNLEDLHLAIALSNFDTLSHTWLDEVDNDPIYVGRQFPNLKILELDCTLRGIGQLNSFLLDLIRGAVELNQLHLSLKSTEIEPDNMPALMTLGTYPAQLNNLKILKMEAVKWNELQRLSDLALLEPYRLHLEQFALSMEYNEIGPFFEAVRNAQGFNLFLATQSSTLRRLSILFARRFRGFTDDIGPRVQVQLPRMAELRALKLRGEGRFEIGFEGGTGTLIDAFPNLQRLELEWNLMEGEGRGDVIQINQLTHHSVTELIITGIGAMYVWSQGSDEELAELSKRLPSVKRFEAFIPSDHIPQCIWTAWPLLTVLHLEYTDHSEGVCSQTSNPSVELDEWLTGIPKSRHQALQTEPGYQKICAMTDASGRVSDSVARLAEVRTLHAKYKSLPGLSDLHCLRSFTLIVVPLNSRWICSLTDIGGYLGLAMANPGLERLVIRHNNQEFLAIECKSLIRFVLGPYAVIEPGGEWPWAREGDGTTGRLLSNYSPGLN